MNSVQYQNLSAEALNLIGDLHAVNKRLDEISKRAGTAGIEDMKEDETTIQWLGRVAAECNEKHFDALREENKKLVTRAVERGVVETKPRSWLGRKLGDLSKAIG